MNPQRISRQRGRRCGAILSAAVFCAAVCVASSGTVPVQNAIQAHQQSPAEDRQGGGFFDSLSYLNPFGAAAPAQPPMSIPDVSGFGMYPLWKFHKFDGLSLRPVPYGVDIGSGLPPPPHPPSYPAGFLPASQPTRNYGPPASPPPTNYESAAPSAAPNYSPASSAYAPAPAPAYTPSYNAPQEYQPQHQIMNYQPSYTPQSNNYGSYNQAPAQGSYSQNEGSYNPIAPRYNEPAGAYSAPAPAATYAEPQYGNSQQSSNYGSQMAPASAGYDNLQYAGTSQPGITIQFNAAPPQQEFAVQQQPGSYSPSPSASFQMPTYSAMESPISVSYGQGEQKATDATYGNAGFMKRSEIANNADSSDGSAATDMNYNM